MPYARANASRSSTEQDETRILELGLELARAGADNRLLEREGYSPLEAAMFRARLASEDTRYLRTPDVG